jgi:tyrosyl-tRNA synthetase
MATNGLHPDSVTAMNIYEDLQWRGLIANATFVLRSDHVEPTAHSVGASTAMSDPGHGHAQVDPAKVFTVYCGFDPSADSLHVGNLVPLLALRRFQLAGHRPIALAGGATGSIGDPSGKSSERQLLNAETLANNIAGVEAQLKRLLDFEVAGNPARLLNNATWTEPVRYLEFLRDFGKYFSVNMMVAKESVRARMEDRECGISYTEFSYMLLQAFDFYLLCRDFDCDLQIGGSDQWGNITGGIDLCRKKLGRAVHGLVLPLITNADGSKFGKTVQGAIWLDARKTSVYRFYQYWINTDDRDVVRYLKFFTFLERKRVEELAARHELNPGAREAHQTLAREVTTLVHGATATADAISASQVLFGGSLEAVSEAAFAELLGEVPTCSIPMSQLNGDGVPLIDLLVHAGLVDSKNQARQALGGGGVYVNNIRETSPNRAIGSADLLFGQHLLLRRGKKNYAVITAQ